MRAMRAMRAVHLLALLIGSGGVVAVELEPRAESLLGCEPLSETLPYGLSCTHVSVEDILWNPSSHVRAVLQYCCNELAHRTAAWCTVTWCACNYHLLRLYIYI